MAVDAQLDARLEQLSADVEAWILAFFELHRPASDRFAGLLSYPLGWVDVDLRQIVPPAPAGKRLRAALCLLICEAIGGDHRAALAPAAAIELVHNFSLVHDDIQDESPLRRGRPTVWSQWKTAQAINVGDSLFALAHLALLRAEATTPALLVQAAQRLDAACLRLVEGQFLDLELQAAGRASLEDYQTMVGGKTAALLECAAWLGARFGGADDQLAERFADFGRLLGLAFQFQDDLIGIWGDPALTGKPIDSDLRGRKQALPAVLALQSDGPQAARFRELFLSPAKMSAADGRAAAGLLEAMGIRERVRLMVEQGYSQTAHELSVALGRADRSTLHALLERLQQRDT